MSFMDIFRPTASMSLWDILRPKWKHPDPEVRKAAVEQIEEQSVLAKVVKKDSDADIRYRLRRESCQDNFQSPKPGNSV